MMLDDGEFTLGGDHIQLIPPVQWRRAIQEGLRLSALQRLWDAPGMLSTTLSVQYRMTPNIRRWPNGIYCQTKLVAAQGMMRTHASGLTHCSHHALMQRAFIDIYGRERNTRSGSCSSTTEARACIAIVEKHSGDKNITITFVTMYDAHRALIRTLLDRDSTKDCMGEVCSVASCQGRECDVV